MSLVRFLGYTRLSCGCVVVAYDAGNLPFIVNGLGCIVPAGDRGGLTAAVMRLSEAIAAGGALKLEAGEISYPDFLQRAFEYSKGFEFGSFAAKFAKILRSQFHSPTRVQAAQ